MVDLKYSSTVSPSRKLALIGVSMILPDGLAIKPHAGQLTNLLDAARAPEWAIKKIGLTYRLAMIVFQSVIISVVIFSRRAPGVEHLLYRSLGDDAAL